MAQSFDAFISYRRSDANVFAKRLRRELQDFRPPRPLRRTEAPSLRVYLDTIYELGTNDFFERVTLPALLSSRHLIVVATPDAVDRGPEENDWIRREIAAFEAGPNAGNILVVRALPGARLPADLEHRYPNIEIIDLQGLSPVAFLNPAKATRLADEKVKLLAPLLGIGVDDMPALRREEERRQQVRLGLTAGSATAILLAVLALATVAFYSRNQALDALSRSMFATDRMIQSVSSSLPEGESKNYLLAGSCDLLDSLLDGAQTQPRAYSRVLCLLSRAKNRELLGELDAADELVADAVRIADQRFSAGRSADDGLAVLAARRADLDRAIARDRLGSGLSDFLSQATACIGLPETDWYLPRFAAHALQHAAVSLVSKGRLDDALQAVDGTIEFGRVALDRGADLAFRLDYVVATKLKSEVHLRKKDLAEAAQADSRSRTLLNEIRKDEAERLGLGSRLKEVTGTVGAPASGTR